MSHVGIAVKDFDASIASAVARMRQQGTTVADPGLTPGRALFSRLRDPDGVQIEIMEFGPELLEDQMAADAIRLEAKRHMELEMRAPS